MFDKIKKNKFLTLSLVSCCVIQGTESDLLAKDDSSKTLKSTATSEPSKNGYTINFSNVSIKEYLKFIGKIADLNFIYDEADLNFNVTIVSEEAAELPSILSALVQVLKIHGLSLIDDGINLIINRAPATVQIATVISDEYPLQDGANPPLITSLIKVKNANPTSAFSILQALLSQSAILELSRETRHIIITDTPTNISKAKQVLDTLDSSSSPLEISSYSARNNSSINLVTLATQIVMPLSEGNPVIMVPQPISNMIFVVSTPFLNKKTLDILAQLDSAPIARKDKVLSGENILLYQVQYKSADVILKAILQICASLQELGYAPSGLLESLETVRYIAETNSLLFNGEPDSLKKTLDLISGIDVPGKPLPSSQNSTFFMYRPVNRALGDFVNILYQFADNLHSSNYSDQHLVVALKGLKIINSSDSILFTSDEGTISEIKSITQSLDTPSQKELEMMNEKFYIYHIKIASHESLAKSLTTVADNLEMAQYPDKDLIACIDSMQWIPETNSLLFTGNEKSLKQLQEMLPTFDSDNLLDLTDFMMYTPVNLDGDTLLAAVENLSLNLHESGLANPVLIRTLQNARWVPSSKALVFTGPPETLAKIKALLPTIDRSGASAEKTEVFVYRPTNIPLSELVKALQNLESNLPHEDDLYEMLSSMKTAEDSQSIVLKGTKTATTKLQEILRILDSPEQAHLAAGSSTYFIYKLKETSGDIIIQDLDKIVKNLKASGFDDRDFALAVNSIEWIKSTNSLYVAGTPDALKKIKDLFEEFDVKTQGQVPSEYLLYKPVNLSGKDLLTKLKAIERGLVASGLSNPELLSTISTVQYLENTQSLVFTGTATSIINLKDILASIESEVSGTTIKDLGKKTYLIYKLKYVPGPQLIGYLRTLSQDITSNKADENSIGSAIDSARYISETNSVIFTGSPEALAELQKVIEKFDISTLAPATSVNPPAAYFVYQPQFVSGQTLITILHDFQKQLINSGLQDADLYHTIANLKYLDKTKSITVAGTDEAVKQVEDLLKKFDVVTNSDTTEVISSTSNITNHQDVSFLIYKLKYHQGSEIEDALKKIALELGKEKEEGQSSSLVKAIESVQWIQVTNSLIGTGSPHSLAKLKNLIENIDTPLQQIFIEVLVLETSLNSALDFGLRWAGQGNYKNKLAYSTGAFPNFPSGSDPFNSFNTALQGTNASTTPTGSQIPFSSGFGLGVIGDLIYHKGQSYTALGSLIDCLRQDGDTTIVLSQKVIAQDNQPATIFTGDNIPFTGSTVQNVASNATVFSANLEYKDIGVSLTLTPRVGDDGLITISIDQEISEDLNMGNQATATTSGSATAGSVSNPNVFGITTSKTSMQTQATIPDKHFLVFSGMMRNQKVKTRTGIPCLGGLPIIGAAFSDTNITTVKKNVIIFVRPEIIQNIKAYKQITERQEDLFRSQADREDFDQGLELVKTPDDE
jgi:type II secretory pathway component GspD/PulD (secretin)